MLLLTAAAITPSLMHGPLLLLLLKNAPRHDVYFLCIVLIPFPDWNARGVTEDSR